MKNILLVLLILSAAPAFGAQSIIDVTNDRGIYNFDGTWENVESPATGDYVSADSLRVGAKHIYSWPSNNYHMFRTALSLDIPAGIGIIDSMIVYMTCWGKGTSAPDSLVLVYGTQAAPVTTSDYRKIKGAPLKFSVFYSSALATEGTALFRLNQAGLDSAMAHDGGTLKLGVLGGFDYNFSAGNYPVAPDTTKYVWFYSSTDIGDRHPYAVLYYRDPPPSNFTMNSISTDSILATWTDNAYDETGYEIRDLADTTTVIASPAADATSIRLGGLSVNSKHRWFIKVIGGNGNGLRSAADSCFTRANTPKAVTLSFPADSTAKVVLDTTDGNPDSTEYAIQDSVTQKYVNRATGQFQDTADWNTKVGWGGAVAGVLIAIGVGRKYVMRAKARSGLKS